MPLVNEGSRVRIRPIVEGDLEALDRWRRDSEALAGFHAPLIRSPATGRRQLAESGLITPEYAAFAIEAIEDARLVGKVGYSKDSPHVETMARTLSLIGDPADRGRGYATEARLLLVNYLFLSTSLERIYSETDEENTAAQRSLEKCGMQREGVLRHLFFDLGRWVDMAVYSILRDEWAASEMYAPYREAFVTPWTREGG